ncbi:MAG: RIP metalloprotease RseP, partial [Bacteroidetes bacterium]|nr:RIP metalloprotease RseP [Bacteroidota bacterium]
GHFLAAKAFGMKVDKFYIFFDFGKVKLFSFKRKETEYGIGWFPLGGYVKIAGMIDESMDKEQLAKPPQAWEFRAKPRWQRLIVMVAGVFMNLLLGIFIFSMISFYYGETHIPVSTNDPAIVAMQYGEEIGFQTGDTLVEINGTPFSDFKKFTDMYSFELLLSNNIDILVKRDGKLVTITTPDDFLNTISDRSLDLFIQPAYSFHVRKVKQRSNAERGGLKAGDKIIAVDQVPINYYYDFVQRLEGKRKVDLRVLRNQIDTVELSNVQIDEEGKIGFFPEFEVNVEVTSYAFFQSFKRGNQKAWFMLKENTIGFAKLFQGEVDPRKAIKGPVGIATIYGGEWIWVNFWTITGLLSLILAFMNLLPIPALDGGHVITILIEMISGRTIGTKTMEVIQTIGMIIVFGLIIFSIFNDVFQQWFAN